MTKEEAINVLLKVRPCIIDNAQEDALDIAIEALSKPSLPSNLDEAAENCTYCEHAYARESFKEGAEWMAGNGVSVDASVVPYDDGLGLNMPDEDILSGKFKDGDKVVVQIRKK